jgi:hypothetical protein
VERGLHRTVLLCSHRDEHFGLRRENDQIKDEDDGGWRIRWKIQLPGWPPADWRVSLRSGSTMRLRFGRSHTGRRVRAAE